MGEKRGTEVQHAPEQSELKGRSVHRLVEPVGNRFGHGVGTTADQGGIHHQHQQSTIQQD